MANETKSPVKAQGAANEIADDKNHNNNDNKAANNKQKPQISFFEGLFFKRFVASTADVLGIVVINLVSFFMVKFILSGFDTSFIKISILVSGLIWLMGGLFLLLRDGPIPITAFDGRSPGKFFLQLQVTDLEKNPLTYKMSIERNFVVAGGVIIGAIGQILSAFQLPFISLILSVLISLLSIVWLVMGFRELWAMYKAPDNRRPGDLKAGTIVDYY